ncbi:MAG: isoaspartyl peptidase/L-asparaginase [Anaerolineae bacterium]
MKNPITVARRNLRRTPAPITCWPATGRCASRAATASTCRASSLVAPEVLARWLARRAGDGAVEPDEHDALRAAPALPGDTVGAVARDADGHMAAATSTGGMRDKLPGRVGDSPIIGSGAWADDRGGAVSCTGHGELIMRVCLAHHTGLSLCHGAAAAHAAAAAIRYLEDRTGGQAGLILLDAAGRPGWASNTHAMPVAWAHGGWGRREPQRPARFALTQRPSTPLSTPDSTLRGRAGAEAPNPHHPRSIRSAGSAASGLRPRGGVMRRFGQGLSLIVSFGFFGLPGWRPAGAARPRPATLTCAERMDAAGRRRPGSCAPRTWVATWNTSWYRLGPTDVSLRLCVAGTPGWSGAASSTGRALQVAARNGQRRVPAAARGSRRRRRRHRSVSDGMGELRRSRTIRTSGCFSDDRGQDRLPAYLDERDRQPRWRRCGRRPAAVAVGGGRGLCSPWAVGRVGPSSTSRSTVALIGGGGKLCATWATDDEDPNLDSQPGCDSGSRRCLAAAVEPTDTAVPVPPTATCDPADRCARGADGTPRAADVHRQPRADGHRDLALPTSTPTDTDVPPTATRTATRTATAEPSTCRRHGHGRARRPRGPRRAPRRPSPARPRRPRRTRTCRPTATRTATRTATAESTAIPLSATPAPTWTQAAIELTATPKPSPTITPGSSIPTATKPTPVLPTATAPEPTPTSPGADCATPPPATPPPSATVALPTLPPFALETRRDAASPPPRTTAPRERRRRSSACTTCSTPRNWPAWPRHEQQCRPTIAAAERRGINLLPAEMRAASCAAHAVLRRCARAGVRLPGWWRHTSAPCSSCRLDGLRRRS